MPHIALKASAWNSDCAPLPIMAIVFDPLGIKYFAAIADVAAVRSAVKIVISVNKTGYPVFTSERTPKAVTVCKPS